MTIKKLLTSLNDIKHGQDFEIQGWVQNNRGNEKIKFLALTDGSTVDTLQLVIKSENIKRFNLDKINLGSSIKVKGKLLLTPTAPQPIELAVDDLILINNTDEDFPIQKKETTLDFLREIPHLRHRTNLFRAIMIIRNALLLKFTVIFKNVIFLTLLHQLSHQMMVKVLAKLWLLIVLKVIFSNKNLFRCDRTIACWSICCRI